MTSRLVSQQALRGQSPQDVATRSLSAPWSLKGGWLSQGNEDRFADHGNLVRQTIQVQWAYDVGKGDKHEKARQNQPLEGSPEEKES